MHHQYTKAHPCASQLSPHVPKDVHSQGEVIACLEKGLVREAEEQPGAHAIGANCKKAIMRVAELSSDDFHLDRYLYFSCREDRERFCENVSTFPPSLLLLPLSLAPSLIPSFHLIRGIILRFRVRCVHTFIRVEPSTH